MSSGTVGIVLVSHSAKLAEGMADVIYGLAGYVELATVGGIDVLGATPGDVLETITGMRSDHVLVFCDIGSSTLAAYSALDLADDDISSRVGIVNAPFVEGVLLAAIAAMESGDVSECVEAAESDGANLASAKVPSDYDS